MKHHYQVKYTDPFGVLHYGIVDQYSSEAKEVAKRGACLVDDAVLPKATPVPESVLIDLPTTFDGEYAQYVAAAFSEAQTRANALTTFGVGAMFSIGVADGEAYYVVTAVKGKRCTVEWHGFCPDRYHDHHFGWGGTFPVAEVKRYWDSKRAMEKLFALT